MSELDNDQYKNLCGHLLSLATQHGATSAEVSMTIESGFSVTARLGEVETVEYHQDRGMGITVYIDHQTGSASTSDLSPQALEATVIKACNIASFTTMDPCAGIAEKKYLAFDYPDLKLDYPWDITTDDAIKFTIECEDIARKYDRRITNSEGSSLSTHRGLHIFANSNGFIGSYLSSQHSLNCVLIAEQNNQMQRDFDYTIARDPGDLQSIENLARNAAKRTLDRLGARKLKTCTVPVIFHAPVAKTFLRNFISAISGTNIYRKSSFLINAIGQQIFPRHISIYQQPHILKSLGGAPFDGEGVLTKDIHFVKDGILQNFVLDSYSARKLNLHTTGNAGGIYNLSLPDTQVSFEELLRTMDTGLLVTELIGQGINIVTGDYSRGAFGFWVEKGEIQYPVEEVTIAGNLKDMFLDMVATSNDIDKRGSILSGSILIKKMVVAGE